MSIYGDVPRVSQAQMMIAAITAIASVDRLSPSLPRAGSRLNVCGSGPMNLQPRNQPCACGSGHKAKKCCKTFPKPKE